MDHFTPLQYLKIDVASAFGLDRADWSERLAWFDQNRHQLGAIVNQAKEPALFFAAAEAYEATEREEPTGHMVSLDATASGIQILSVLAGDESAARHCNVLNTGHRQDAYTNIYDLMQAQFPFPGLERKATKYALMTVLYGSEAVPKQVFGEGALLDLFETTVEREMPAVWALNKAFLRMWNPNALRYEWVLPDNFHVNTKVMGKALTRVKFMGQTVDVETRVNEPQPEGRSIGANVTHSLDGYIVREMGRRCSYDPGQIADVKQALHTGGGYGTNRPKDKMLYQLLLHAKASGLLSSRIFDYIDKENAGLLDRKRVFALIDTLPSKPFSLLMNHDCFRVHPNYAGEMRMQYNRQLAELSESETLNFLATQILGVEVRTKKHVQLNSADILAANYALS
jgi:hypothetical protein